MPKPSKTKAPTKTQLKAKRKTQPATLGITTKKSYWVMLSVVMVAVFSVAGYMMELSVVNIVVLMIAIVLLIGLIGYVRITPSNLSKSKRGTFLFVGVSIIGFSVWAVPMYILFIAKAIGDLPFDPFFIVPSLIMCLTLGAFIGELMGKNSRIQQLLFKSTDDAL
jgi:4-hydroxybenzoate polyprenyltransferase